MFLRYHWQTNCNWLDFSDDGDILIFSSHLRLGLSNVLVLWGFPTKTIHAFFYFPMRATFSAHVTLLELLTLILSDVILKQPLLNSNKTQQHKTYRGIKYVISCKHVMCWVKKKIYGQVCRKYDQFYFNVIYYNLFYFTIYRHLNYRIRVCFNLLHEQMSSPFLASSA